jgi:hypothetical protein
MPNKFSIEDVMTFAKSKVGIDGWVAYTWEACGDDSLVTGDVPSGIYRSGPRKGKQKFTGPGRKVVVTRQEMQAKATAYESDTGKCWDCKGTGQVWAGWSKTDGTRYRDCQRCNATGNAASQSTRGTH